MAQSNANPTGLDPTSPVGANLLRNGSFELSRQFNGAAMRVGGEFIRAVQAGQGNVVRTEAEGWWVDGKSSDGLTLEAKDVHSGKFSLALVPVKDKTLSIFSAPGTPVPTGRVTLSAWVQTAGAKGSLVLEFTAVGRKLDEIPSSISRQRVALPSDAAQWTRIQLTADAPAHSAAVVHVVTEAGRVLADDVQLEAGAQPTAFEVRPEEWLSLSFTDVPAERLAFWKAGDDLPRKLVIQNDSGGVRKGTLEIWMGPWSNVKANRVAVMDDFELNPGKTLVLPISVGKLAPDAYVISAVLKEGGKVVLDGQRMIDASTLIGGEMSNSMLTGRGAIRFALAPAIEPARIFGVGQGMLGYGWKGCESGTWWGGWSLAHFAAAKENGFAGGRGRCKIDDEAYLFAAAGVPLHRMESRRIEEGAPAGSAFLVPGTAGGIDFWNPLGMKFLIDAATKIGMENGTNAQIASYQMNNERPFQFGDGICATAAADAHFRSWCRERHGDLATLNRRWGTAYQSWDEVEQPASARYAEEIKKRPAKQGAAAIDWTASLGSITPEIQKTLVSIPGRGMDWCRWRTWSALWMYSSFRDAAKVNDSKTLYSTNLCWPNFWPQMCMPFFREMDATMLDVMYTAGLPHAMGSPMEMMEIMEMAESNAPDKPIWGIEIYVQPQFPAEYVAFQNWGMLAHGMSNTLVFGWGPYADTGIPKEMRAWEKPKAGAMWMLIDLDGTKLPAYFTNQRSLEEIKAFHTKYDGTSVRRTPTDVAFYVSGDTAEYSSYESANKPYVSLWARTRTTLSYLLRINGVTADFVDDETLPQMPGRFRTVIVPASYVLSQDAAERLAKFARSGGTVILAGTSGVVDPWLNKYENLGGPAWADLQWKAPNFNAEFNSLVHFAATATPASAAPVKPGDYLSGPAKGIDESKTFRGQEIGDMPGAKPISDAAGRTVGWTRDWGKGRLVAYGVLPEIYSGNPHPANNLTAWMRQLIEEGGLRPIGNWNAGRAEGTDGLPGAGAPVVEVVVRARKGMSETEKFIFILNQGGQGSGTIEVPITAGTWETVDVLSGAAVPSATIDGAVWKLKLDVKPWEYRVLRVTKNP